LSISRQIIQQHGDHLALEEEPRQGATFPVHLPASDTPEPKARDGAHVSTEHRGAAQDRILVIDDEDSIRRLLKRVLARLGHQVDLVCDGCEALLTLQRNTYEVVFLDLNIPGLSGVEIYNWIKAHRREMASRTVILTGDTLRPDTLDFLERERVLHLLKPFEFTELTEIMEQIRA